MRCPSCVLEGKRSKVRINASTTTAMSSDNFYDEEGRLHSHNPNSVRTYYTCSEGHSWFADNKRSGCWCLGRIE